MRNLGRPGIQKETLMLLERIGLIDIGSNTIRLVIFEIDEHFTMFQVQNIKTPARLFQYLDKKKKMSQAGIDVLIKVLKSFKSVADQYQVSVLMPVATAAIRQSTNRDDIIKQVRKATKIEMMLLPEEKEAFYGNYAVLHTTQFLNGVTIDIGGGSTEVTYYENKELQQYHSFPFGVVTLKQMFFDGKEHNDPKAIKKMQEFVKDQFKSIKWLSKKQVPIVAMGGSARSIANVHQRKIDYRLAGVHGYRMYKNDLQMTLDLFQSLSIPQLQNLDGLSRDRTDLIIPANVVFNTLFDEVKAPVFLFSNKGLREGIVMEFLNDKYENKAFSVYNIAVQSVSRLAASYHTMAHVAQQRVKLVDMLYEELCRLGIFDKNPEMEKLLHFGSYLYYLGQFVETGASSQHTFYIISNSDLDGISHKERVSIALLASFKNRSLFNQYLTGFTDWYTVTLIDQLQSFGGIIKFADALNDSHMEVIRDIKIIKIKNGYDLVLSYKGDILAEEYRAERQRKHIERLLRGKLNIIFTEC